MRRRPPACRSSREDGDAAAGGAGPQPPLPVGEQGRYVVAAQAGHCVAADQPRHRAAGEIDAIEAARGADPEQVAGHHCQGADAWIGQPAAPWRRHRRTGVPQVDRRDAAAARASIVAAPADEHLRPPDQQPRPGQRRQHAAAPPVARHLIQAIAPGDEAVAGRGEGKALRVAARAGQSPDGAGLALAGRRQAGRGTIGRAVPDRAVGCGAERPGDVHRLSRRRAQRADQPEHPARRWIDVAQHGIARDPHQPRSIAEQVVDAILGQCRGEIGVVDEPVDLQAERIDRHDARARGHPELARAGIDDRAERRRSAIDA
ncbi:hypothetical protein BW41_02579 [Sphingomonas sp. RIT328]|nr:hypothetical protein BW41_02579 [Sphingomonas sp. RIT328]